MNGEIETEKFCLPDCRFDGGDESFEEMINCDICGAWCHLICVDLTPKKATELAFWKCDKCTTFVPNLKQDFMKIQNLVSDMTNTIATLKSIKSQKSEKNSTQDPVRRKIDDDKNLANSTKVKEEMDAQTQELTKTVKTKRLLVKHQKMIQL